MLNRTAEPKPHCMAIWPIGMCVSTSSCLVMATWTRRISSSGHALDRADVQADQFHRFGQFHIHRLKDARFSHDHRLRRQRDIGGSKLPLAVFRSMHHAVLHRRRFPAKMVWCLSNQHQCYLAFGIYASENRYQIIVSGAGPAGNKALSERFWGEYLGGFNAHGEQTSTIYLTRRVAVCPSHSSYDDVDRWMRTRKTAGFDWNNNPGEDSKTYAVNNPPFPYSNPPYSSLPLSIRNWIVPNEPQGKGVFIVTQNLVRLSANSGSNLYGSPSQTVMLADSAEMMSGHFRAAATFTPNSATELIPRSVHMAHTNRANATFYDGHGATMSDEALRYDTASHIKRFVDVNRVWYKLW